MLNKIKSVTLGIEGSWGIGISTQSLWHTKASLGIKSQAESTAI